MTMLFPEMLITTNCTRNIILPLVQSIAEVAADVFTSVTCSKGKTPFDFSSIGYMCLLGMNDRECACIITGLPRTEAEFYLVTDAVCTVLFPKGHHCQEARIVMFACIRLTHKWIVEQLTSNHAPTYPSTQLKHYENLNNTHPYPSTRKTSSMKILKNVSCEYDRWVVETQLCKLRGT